MSRRRRELEELEFVEEAAPAVSGAGKAKLYLDSTSKTVKVSEDGAGFVDLVSGTLPHAATHENGGADEINVGGLSGVLADGQTPAAHALGGAEHTADTLAALNGKVSDATLIDTGDARLSDARTPTAHAASHENGGSDEISVAALSGLLADDQNPTAHAGDHEPGGSDAMAVDAAAGIGSLRTIGTGALQATAGNDARLSDARTPTAHDLGGAEHTADSLAALNSKLTDATLDDFNDSRPPTTHALAGSEHSASTLAALNTKVSDATLDGTGDPRDADAIITTTGPTTLAVGAVADGEFLKRVGATVVGAAAGGATQIDSMNANDAIFPASASAGVGGRNAHPVLNYDDTVNQNAMFSRVISSDYLSASNLNINIDWVAASATTGVVRWGVAIERIALTDIDSDSFDTQILLNGTANGTSGIPTRTTISLTNGQADAIAAGDAYRIRVRRIAADAADTMAGNAQVLRVSLSQ